MGLRTGVWRTVMIGNLKATVEDLYRVPENGNAEIVGGELVVMSPTGKRPSRASISSA